MRKLNMASKENNSKTVLMVNGSPHKRGNTRHAMAIVAEELAHAAIETDWFELGSKPVRGCIACGRCAAAHRCAFADDGCNDLIEKLLRADAVIIGSPVYFAGPNGALCALLDRAFFATANYGQLLAGKPAAAIATCWREGGSATLDRLYKYFSYAQMPIISGDYWTVQLGPSDPWGENVLRTLGRNMAEQLH